MRMPGEVVYHALAEEKKDNGQEDCKQEMSDSERGRLRFLIAHDFLTGRLWIVLFSPCLDLRPSLFLSR
jgi:hypothetical protein